MERVRKKYLTRSKVGDDKDSPLPVDFIIEILTYLPPKSVPKLLCVSKLWSSIVQGKYFTELYLNRSSSRPRLLCQFERRHMCFFHSSSQDNPSSDDRVSITRNQIPGKQISTPIRGLICSRTSSDVVICNPCTGQYITLPRVENLGFRSGKSCFFGYDPVNDQYKVLCLLERLGNGPSVTEKYQVFTLGAQKEWKMIECKHPHCAATNGLYKNGIVYYGAWHNSSHTRSLIMSFDLRTEEFNPIKLPEDAQIIHNFLSRLVYYKGKIALVKAPSMAEFNFWVLDDIKKQEWSKKFVLVSSWKDLVGDNIFNCRGTTNIGELIFAPCEPTDKFFILYYDPKEGKARRVEIEMTGDVLVGKGVFLDHVESTFLFPRKFSR